MTDVKIDDVEVVGLDDIPEIETESVSSPMLDEAEKESEQLDTFKVGDTEEKGEEEEEVIEEEIEEVEEVEETPEPEEKLKPVESNEKVTVEALDAKETANTAYVSAEKELDIINREFELLDYESEKPTKPEDDLDEAANRRYDMRLVMWEDKQKDLQTKGARLQKQMFTAGKKALAAFKNDFEGQDLIGFENWVKDKGYVTFFLQGKQNLYSLHKLYLIENNKLSSNLKVKKVVREGVRTKPINIKSTATKRTGGNGIHPKYKYANMPMFKDLVQEYKGKRSQISGMKYTDKFINELCEQEYKVERNGTVF